MSKVVRRPEVGQEVWIAIDVARSKWAFNVRWDGVEQRRLSTPGTIEHLHSLVQSYAACRVHVAYEACGFGYEIAWWCQAREIAVTVIPPSTVERAPGAHVKTDRVDAAALNLKHEKGLLKGVHIPTRTAHEQRQLSRTYGQVLQDRKRAQMRLRSLMQEHGRLGPVPNAGWARYEMWLRRQEMPAPVALSIEPLLAARAVAAQATRRLRGALRQLARHPAYQPVVQRLSQQAGVGWFTAIRLQLEIGDIRRFTTADSFVHYLGLTPSEYSSGDTVHRGHLLKCGPGVVRGWLLQCAWAAATGKSPDPEFVACYHRLVGRAGKKRAIVAVARRLALRLRARWLEEIAKAESAKEEPEKKAAAA
jgi:transposase